MCLFVGLVKLLKGMVSLDFGLTVAKNSSGSPQEDGFWHACIDICSIAASGGWDQVGFPSENGQAACSLPELLHVFAYALSSIYRRSARSLG